MTAPSLLIGDSLAFIRRDLLALAKRCQAYEATQTIGALDALAKAEAYICSLAHTLIDAALGAYRPLGDAFAPG